MKNAGLGSTFTKKRIIVSVSILAIIVAAALIWFYAGNSSAGKAEQAKKSRTTAVSVLAVPAKQTDFNIYITALGTVTPLNTVTLRTRVDGQLMDVLFKEGQVVKSGDLLARIDPRPFQVQLLQAEGQLTRDQELLKNAKLDLERYRVLWKEDSIPKQQLDTQEALVRQYEGTIKTDEGAIESAKLNLTYCRITAPISGRIGLRLIDPGNIVRQSDATGLLVITQIEPISVLFPIPEDSLQSVLAGMREGKKLPVVAYDREMKQKLATGYLLTVDNQIDTTTGTVRLRGGFANKEHELFPNQFVNVRLLMGVQKDAIVVPSSAIQRGPKGTFVYVVKADSTAEMRAVTIGEIQSGYAPVQSGLSGGETVVIDGSDRLREGAKVEVRTPGAGRQRKAS